MSCRRSTSGCGHRRGDRTLSITSAQTTWPATDAGTPRSEQVPPSRLRRAVASRGNSSGREMTTDSPRARRSTSQVSCELTFAFCGCGRGPGAAMRARVGAPHSVNSMSWQPRRDIAAATCRAPPQSPPPCRRLDARQPSRERDGELRRAARAPSRGPSTTTCSGLT